jgi:hypothetical protein
MSVHRLGTMTSDDEKDPPVPAHLEGAPKRIRHVQGAEEQDLDDHETLADEPDD